jgi:hypothetical protein
MVKSASKNLLPPEDSSVVHSAESILDVILDVKVDQLSFSGVAPQA